MIRLIALILITTLPLAAKHEDFGRVIRASSKHKISNMDQRIPRNQFDQDIDTMIELRLGRDYRRANVYDFYPLEIKGSKARWKAYKTKAELMDYYDYARKDLEHLNQSKFLKVLKQDFNLDSKNDYAVVVYNSRKKKVYLAIMDYQELHYLELFNASYLEIMNDARYPTTVVYKSGKKRKVIDSPSFRTVAFDGKDELIYYDQDAKKWRSLVL
ncbi:MAG: hypothetical protein OXU45_07955 [Candidatus Melainabacteria bacterium]|nr:hypothetical protein [Candidatus Melainabacteria bacterium]